MSSIVDDRLNQLMREDRKFEQQMDYHDTFGKKMSLVTRWSIYEGDLAFGVTYDGRLSDKSPFVPGTLIHNRCESWGYRTVAVVGGNGLWSDVWVACDNAIRNAIDDEGNTDHHVFIEGFERMDSGDYRVITGS